MPALAGVVSRAETRAAEDRALQSPPGALPEPYHLSGTNMSPQQLPACPHDVRPGTTVCLHCRHEARMLARGRTKALLVRLGIGAAGVAALGVALIGGASVIQARLASSDSPKHAANRATPASGVEQAGTVAEVSTTVSSSALAPSAGGPPQQQSVALRAADRNPSSALVTTPPRGALATPPGPTLESSPIPRGAPVVPVLQEGRTDFDAGVFAERAGNNVVVHFDTPETRTRRRDKLEQIVRATLPRVYGPAVDSALAKIPAGGLTNGRDPVSELTARGMWVPLDKGWTLAVWPQTRPGQDGPLVVTYRVAVTH